MRIACLYLFFILLPGIIPGIAAGQEIVFNRIKAPKNYPYTLISSIQQDASGYIWFTSGPILYRYDGYNFVIYKRDYKQPQALHGDNLECLYIDRDGIIWIGDLFKGLNRFDPRTGLFSHYRYNAKDPTSISSDHISVILGDHLGNLWVGTPDGLNLLNKELNTFTRFVHDPNDPSSISCSDINSLYEDRAGTLWIGTGGAFHGHSYFLQGGLNKFDRKRGKFTRYMHDPNDSNSLIDNRVKSILEDSRGVFWIGTSCENGLHTMDREKGTFTRHYYDPANPTKLSRPPQLQEYSFAEDHVTFLKEDITGAIWIGTFAGGLSRYDPGTQKITHYNARNDLDSLHEEGVWSMLSARDGIIWLGSWEGGKFDFYTIDPLRVNVNYTRTNDYITTYSSSNNPSDNFYVGGYGLSVFDKNKKLIKYYRGTDNIEGAGIINNLMLSSNSIATLFTDRQGMLWIGMESSGISMFNPETERFTHYLSETTNKNSLSSPWVLSILEDSQGDLWVGTINGLNLMNRKNGTFTHFKNDSSDNNSLANNHVAVIYEDPSGNLWIGNKDNGGLHKFHRNTGKFEHILPEKSVYAVFTDAAGTLWTSTENGLYYMTKGSKKIEQYIDQNFLYDPIVIFSISEDGNRNLWMTSSSGIVILDPQRKHTRFLTSKEKFSSGIATYFPGYMKRNGDFIVGDILGFFTISPSELLKIPKSPDIVVSNFKITGNQKNLAAINFTGPLNDSAINLKHNQNIFSFDFTAIHYGEPELNRHMYMLESYDEAWRIAGSDRKISYINVPPGNYILKLKASNANGIWAEKKIVINISPAWWSTWWFRAIAILLALAAIYSVVRWSVHQRFRNQLERSEKEKQLADLRQKTSEMEMFALRSQMNPHFIFNSLNSINRFILQNNKAQASAYLTKFSKLVRLIFHNSESALISIENEIEALQLYLELEALRFNNHFEYKIIIQEGLEISELKVPPLIIQPYVENAIWHGLMHKEEKGSIEIELYQEDEVLVCKIRDDGIGRKKASELKSISKSTHKSSGMRITADRISLLEQQKMLHTAVQVNDLALPDGSAGGTEVIIKLPVRYD